MRTLDEIACFRFAWDQSSDRAARRVSPLVHWAFSGQSMPMARDLALKLASVYPRLAVAPVMLRYWFGLAPPVRLS